MKWSGLFTKEEQSTLTGYVDTLIEPKDAKTPHNYGAPFAMEFGVTYAPAALGGIIHEEMADAPGTWCLRTNWNENPNQYVAIPEVFRPYLRPGDLVEFKYSKEGSSKWCIGTLTTIISINGRSFVRRKDRLAINRPHHWLHKSAREILPMGPSYLSPKGTYTRFLELLHAKPGLGDSLALIAGPSSGKSTLIKFLVSERRRDPQTGRPLVKTVYVISERPIDLNMFLESVGEHDDVEVFSAVEATPDIQKLANIKLAIWRACRLAEDGYDVLFVVESITKAVAKPLNALPSPPGAGFQTGGYNQLTTHASTFVLDLAGRVAWGSISVMAVVLVEGDPASEKLAAIAQGACTATVRLSAEVTGWPKVQIKKTRQRDGSYLVSTLARFQSQHTDPAICKAALELAEVISAERIEAGMYRDIRDMNTGSGARIPVVSQAISEDARIESGRRLERMLEMIRLGVPAEGIFAEFGIECIRTQPDSEDNFPVHHALDQEFVVTPPTTRPPLKHERGEAEVGQPAASAGGARAPRAAA